MTPETVMKEQSDALPPPANEISEVRLRIKTLQLSCEILDEHFDSLDDDGFWELTGRYFLRVALRLEALDGTLRWDVAALELGALRQAYAESLSERNAEKALGPYLFNERALLFRLIGHLVAYARKRAAAPTKRPCELH